MFSSVYVHIYHFARDLTIVLSTFHTFVPSFLLNHLKLVFSIDWDCFEKLKRLLEVLLLTAALLLFFSLFYSSNIVSLEYL